MTDDCIHGVALDETCVLCCRTSARKYREQRDDCKRELEAANIENTRLREAFVVMERAANQHEADLAVAQAQLHALGNKCVVSESAYMQQLEADLAAARAVLAEAEVDPTEDDSELAARAIYVNRAAWQAWQARAAKEPA